MSIIMIWEVEGTFRAHKRRIYVTCLALKLAEFPFQWKKSNDSRNIILISVNNGTQGWLWMKRAIAFEFKNEETTLYDQYKLSLFTLSYVNCCNSFLNDQTLLLQGL